MCSICAGASVWSRPDGGFFVWVSLPKGVRASLAIKMAMADTEFPTGALHGNQFSPSQRCGEPLLCPACCVLLLLLRMLLMVFVLLPVLP